MLAARVDERTGQRVRLPTTLAAGRSYTLVPGPVQDAAGIALDVKDGANRAAFALGDTLTVTLSASDPADVLVAVEDPAGGIARLHWRGAFVALTGVTRADRILDASVSLRAESGVAQTVALRRLPRPGEPAPMEPDAQAGASSVKKRVTLTGPRLVETVRAWLEHPARDLGHSIELPDSSGPLRFRGGPVLTVTYRLR